MNWDAISAISEFVGVVLIVASMNYVARQVHQTNTMMRMNTASERLERDYEIVAPLIESSELAGIWLKGENEFASLGPIDQQRPLFFERLAIMLWHHHYQLHQQGLMPDANWNESVWIVKKIGRRQVVREAWRLFRDGFGSDFQEFIDETFAKADKELSEGAIADAV